LRGARFLAYTWNRLRNLDGAIPILSSRGARYHGDLGGAIPILSSRGTECRGDLGGEWAVRLPRGVYPERDSSVALLPQNDNE